MNGLKLMLAAKDAQSWMDLAMLLLASLVGAFLVYLSSRLYYRGYASNTRLELSLIPAGLLATLLYQQTTDWPGFTLTLIIVLSIIHFRSVVRDSTDVLFVLWAILSGLFIGAGYPFPVLAVDGVLTIGGIVLARRRSSRITYLLLVRYSPSASEPLMAILRPLHGVMISQIERGGMISMTIEIPLRSVNLALVDTINAIDGVHHVVMVNHEGNDPI